MGHLLSITDVGPLVCYRFSHSALAQPHSEVYMRHFAAIAVPVSLYQQQQPHSDVDCFLFRGDSRIRPSYNLKRR